MADEFESGVLTNELRRPFWHRQGTYLPEVAALTWPEALRAGGLDWQAKAIPLDGLPYTYLDAELRMQRDLLGSDRYQVIVREPNGTNVVTPSILGVVGPIYEAIQPAELGEYTAALLGALDEEAIIVSAVALREGSTIAFCAKTAGFNVAGHSPVDRYLVVSSTFDGTSSIRADETSIVTECMNTLMAGFSAAQRTIMLRHTTGVRERMQQAARLAQTKRRYDAMLEETARRLAELEYSAEAFEEEFAPRLLAPANGEEVSTRTKRQREALVDNWYESDTIPDALRFTRWGALQAATEYDQHQRPRRQSGVDDFTKRFQQAVWGSSAKFSEQALEILSEPLDQDDINKAVQRKLARRQVRRTA